MRSRRSQPRLVLPHFALNDIAPDIEHLQSIQVVQVILQVELAEPQWREEGGEDGRELGGAD